MLRMQNRLLFIIGLILLIVIVALPFFFYVSSGYIFILFILCGLSIRVSFNKTHDRGERHEHPQPNRRIHVTTNSLNSFICRTLPIKIYRLSLVIQHFYYRPSGLHINQELRISIQKKTKKNQKKDKILANAKSSL